jgi:serine/threonine protein kinase
LIDPQAISPLLDHMIVGEAIGQGSNGTVYAAKDTETERLYIVKHISIPQSPTQVEALLYTGAVADEEEAQNYYAQSVQELETELEQLNKLASCPFIQNYTGAQIEPKQNAVGYDCYLVMPFSVSLQRFLDRSAMTHLRALNMGVDLCSAMEALREEGLIHCDIKPQNIFINQYNQYMLGDVGVVRRDELAYTYLSDQYVGDYTAPELRDALTSLNETMDIYALGLILYRIYNGNHAPFEDEKTTPKEAEQQRLDGVELPAPMYADYELAEIIRKACAFDPAERYQTPSELQQALVLYMKRNCVADELIVPPIYVDEDVTVPEEAHNETVEPVSFTDVNDLDDEFIRNFAPGTGEIPDFKPEMSADEAEARQLLSDMERDEVAETVTLPPKPEPAPEKHSGGHGKLIAVLLSLFLILGAAAAGLYYYLYIYGIQIEYMQAYASSTDSISVTINASSADNSFRVVCEGGGETYYQDYAGATYHFDDLEPGTEYTISVEPVGFREIRGVQSTVVSTLDSTEVTRFEVTEVTANEAIISIDYEGQAPEGWTLTYSTDDLDPVTENIYGNEIRMTGLQSNTTYYFVLAPSDDTEVQGTLECSATTLRTVTMGAAKATMTDATEVTVEWSAVGDYEGLSWTVTCEGSDGSTQSVTVTDFSATFDDLAFNTDYTVTVACADLPEVSPVTTTFSTLSYAIENLTATVEDAGTVTLTWDIDAVTPPDEWTITYKLENSTLEPSITTVQGTTATITGLIPNSTYTFEVKTVAELGLEGNTSVSATTPQAEQFTGYGISSLYTSLFLQPTKEDWTVNDLATRKTSFKPSEGVAFAIQAVYGVSSDEDKSVTTAYVVRNSDGDVVDYYTGERTWNGLWTRAIHCGGLDRTPQEPGDYTIDVYFDSQLLTTLEFTVIPEDSE